jgi:hypothetical protein
LIARQPERGSIEPVDPAQRFLLHTLVKHLNGRVIPGPQYMSSI